MATIRVHKTDNVSLSETAKAQIVLPIPTVIEEWQVMSIMSTDVVDRCVVLAYLMAEHNYDINRAVGAPFADQRFSSFVFKRLDKIIVDAKELSDELGKDYMRES